MNAIMHKSLPFRPNDLIYDPLFTVSGPKDAFKIAMLAKLKEAKFQICPVFANMFSDIPHYPSKQLIRRHKVSPLPACLRMYKKSHTDHAEYRHPADVRGSNRPKYFFVPKRKLSGIPETSSLPPEVQKVEKSTGPQKKTKKTQTEYRESEAQTIPWEPSFVVQEDTDPELLKLDFLKWGDGLPAGVHEILLIERARMKRAWENVMREEYENDFEKRREIIELMERDEWAFREQEIQDLQDLRMNLLEDMLNELNDKCISRLEAKTRSFALSREAEKQEQLRKLQAKTHRELRKVSMKELGISRNYTKTDVVTYNLSLVSDLYGPQIRFGENPKRWHQVIDNSLQRYKAQFVGVENFNTLPNWLKKATKGIEKTKPMKPMLCERETKWSSPILKLLHEELLRLRDRPEEIHYESLLIRIPPPPAALDTPKVDGIADYQENLFQACCKIQAIIKGRAAQSLIYEGRDRCKELIKELRYNHDFRVDKNKLKREKGLEVLLQQRTDAYNKHKMLKLQESLRKLQGRIVGSLLDFLNKELRRLMEERRIHAMCLLFERERAKREAAEAGRRQQELRRRREHDEIFRQIIKIDQESVDLYLQNIITEGMNLSSEEEARSYVQNLARKIEEKAYQSVKSYEMSRDEEMIAHLLHEFVLPEAQKQFSREIIIQKQQEKLKVVHEVVTRKIKKIEQNPDQTVENQENPVFRDKSHDCNCEDVCTCEKRMSQ